MRLVWVVYPNTGRVYICEIANRIRVVQGSEQVTGGDALPGFELSIDTLFSGLSKPS